MNEEIKKMLVDVKNGKKEEAKLHLKNILKQKVINRVREVEKEV